MNIIFIIILVTLAGLLFGLLLAKLFVKISTWLLSLKIKKEILKKDTELTDDEIKRRKFKLRDENYNLQEQVKYELSKKVKFKDKIKNLFDRRKKGVSDYGTKDTGNAGLGREQVSTINEGVTTGNNPVTNETATGEQSSTDTAQPNGEQRNVNNNLP